MWHRSVVQVNKAQHCCASAQTSSRPLSLLPLSHKNPRTLLYDLWLSKLPRSNSSLVRLPTSSTTSSDSQIDVLPFPSCRPPPSLIASPLLSCHGSLDHLQLGTVEPARPPLLRSVTLPPQARSRTDLVNSTAPLDRRV
jgi:hypothetical protein